MSVTKTWKVQFMYKNDLGAVDKLFSSRLAAFSLFMGEGVTHSSANFLFFVTKSRESILCEHKRLSSIKTISKQVFQHSAIFLLHQWCNVTDIDFWAGSEETN